MRVRKKRNGHRRLAACLNMLVDTPVEAFKNKNPAEAIKRPLCLEIGCGKGKFITEKARLHPECDFIAMELVTDVIMLALERAASLDGGCPSNLRFINGNANRITEIFTPDSVSRIFLNFSDPWPKERHAKRRLTYRGFLDEYKKILTKDGELVIKTDNDDFFNFALEELTACGWTLHDLTRDLHASPYVNGNIMTEYETNFTELGKNINYVRAMID